MSESNSTRHAILQRGDNSEGAIDIIRILFLFVSLVGVICTLILMTSRKYRGTSYAVYFRCVVVVDFGCLMTWNLSHIDDGLTLMTGSTVHFFLPIEACLLTNDIRIALSISSSWILVAATTDRFISLRYPQFCASWCTKRRAIIVCVVIFILSIVLSMVRVFVNITNVVSMYKNYDSNGKWCELDGTEFNKWYDIFLFVFVVILIPLPIMLTMSVKIVNDLSNRPHTDDMASPLTVTSRSNEDRDNMRHSSYTLTVTGIVSLLTLLPVCLAETVETMKKYTHADFTGFDGSEDTMWRVFDLMSNINYVCKFYIMMAASRMYRRDFMQLCRCQNVVDNGENDLNELDHELETL